MSIASSKILIVHVPFGCRQRVLLTFLALFVCALGVGRIFFAFIVGLFGIVACANGTFSLFVGS